jgi:hypothetical protein
LHWISLSEHWITLSGLVDHFCRTSGSFGTEYSVLDSINYQESGGNLLPGYQQLVNQIKGNLRQIKNKLATFDCELTLAFDL